ncbi:MAG: hypothetical protein ACUVXA_15465 [Candidatus Jordarchaeum sp.]|uniref:hypothetical protein n=1 Tax=Candidatus Jordarchaeum sp. TaxID=2823881 RepID=UPI00404B41A6
MACWLEAPPGGITLLERAVRRTLRPLAEYKLFFRSLQEGSGIPLLELLNQQNKTWKWSPDMFKIKIRKEMERDREKEK